MVSSLVMPPAPSRPLHRWLSVPLRRAMRLAQQLFHCQYDMIILFIENMVEVSVVDKHGKTIEQRLAEFCDRAEIQDLAIRYAHAVRTKNADMIMSLFADPAATLDLDDTCPHFGDDKYSHDRMRRIYEDGMN